MTLLDEIKKFEIPTSIADNRWHNHPYNSEAKIIQNEQIYYDDTIVTGCFGDLYYETQTYKITLTIFKI